MLSHALENGVLVLTVDDEPGPHEQSLAVLISDLVHVHAPTPAVVVLGAVVTDPVIEAVVEAHHRCRQLDVLMSVATPSAPARRGLQAHATTHGGAWLFTLASIRPSPRPTPPPPDGRRPCSGRSRFAVRQLAAVRELFVQLGADLRAQLSGAGPVDDLFRDGAELGVGPLGDFP